MNYELFITDYDRTLGDGVRIEKSTVDAIKAFCDKGGKFVICSGRVEQSIRSICLSYGFKGLVVSYQGAMVSDIETGKVIRDWGLEKDLAKEIAKDFIKKGFDVAVDIGGKRFWEKHDGLMKVYVDYGGTSGEQTESVIAKIDSESGAIEKVCAMCMPEEAESFSVCLNEKYKGSVEFNSGSPIIIEAIDPLHGKGAAVKFLANYYDIPLNKVIAVGDSTNDISLISGEWHGVAVGSGDERLKAVAKEVTVPFDENPVKYLLEKYCL